MHMNTNKVKKIIGIIIMLIIMIIPTGFVFIHDILAQSNVETDEQIDLTLGAIEALDSVNSIPDLIFVMETLLRVPISELKDGEPPYNQEPPDAQQDFRRPTNMPPTMAPLTQPPPTMMPPTVPPPTMMPPPTMRPTAFPTFQPPPTRMPTPPTMRPTRRPFPPPAPPTILPPPPTQPPPPPTQNPNDDVPNNPNNPNN